MNMKVVYTIEKTESWRNKDGIDIKSNIADDKMVECRMAETLVEYLKKESAILEPDKLLLGFAEAQKRGITNTLEDLDNIELNIKNKSDAIQLKLHESCEENEKKYFELEEKFSKTSDKINEKLSGVSGGIENDLKKVDEIFTKLEKINGYKLENLMSTLSKILELVNKDKDLVKMVLEREK